MQPRSKEPATPRSGLRTLWFGLDRIGAGVQSAFAALGFILLGLLGVVAVFMAVAYALF